MKHLKSIFKKIVNFYKKHEYLRVFSFIWLVAFVLFSIQTIPNGLTIPLGGDYVLQQLHFYVEGHDAFWNFFKTGEFQMWSYEGFLGYNYFAGNTFYYLTSPFSLPIYFLPVSLIPQGIYIMMTIKIATAGLFMYILFKKFYHTSNTTALIGGVAYAFCGWGFYYLWFNHFHDVLAVLPLTLIGVEYCIQKRKGFLLTIGLVCCGLVNYYFLFTFVFSTMIYALFRYFQCFKKNKGHNLSIIIQGVVFSALGIGICAFIILPAFNVVTTMSRVGSSNALQELLSIFFKDPVKLETGYKLGKLKSFKEFFNKESLKTTFDYFFVFKNERVRLFFYPLTEFVFPPTGCWENMLFSRDWYDNTFSSLYITMPLLLLVWPRLFLAFKSKKVSHILASLFLIIAPFTPFIYYLTSGFSSVLYGRWLIVIVIMVLVTTIPIIDHLTEIPRIYIDFSFLITVSIMIVCIGVSASIGAFTNDIYHILGCIGVILYVCLTYYIMREKLSTPTISFGKRIGTHSVSKVLLVFVIIDILVVGNISTYIQGVLNYWDLYGGQNMLKEQRTLISEIQKEDPSFYRIFDSAAARDNNNLALTLGYKGLGSFHSVYNIELNTFVQDWTKASYSYGNWSMGIDEKRYNLDTFLNVKYYLLKQEDINVPLGFTKIKETEHYALYRNDYFVELGYAFDSAISIDKFTTGEHFFKESALTSMAVLQDQDINEIVSIMGDDLELLNKVHPNYEQNLPSSGTIEFRPRETTEWTKVSSIYDIAGILAEERNGSLYGPWKENNMPFGDTIRITMPSSSPMCPDAEDVGGYHIVPKLRYGPNVDIRFYHNDELLTHDAHGVNYYGHENDHKHARGFYVDKSVTSIELELVSDAKPDVLFRYNLSFFAEPFTDYQARMNKLALSPLENITHTNNTISFTTDYENKKFVVLSVPYDAGWKLTVDGEEAKIYKADSGFIGLIASEGEHSYHLQYTTPNIIKGTKISVISLVIFGGLTTCVVIVDKKKKKKEEAPQTA